MNRHFIFIASVFFILFVFNGWAKAQQNDTIFFDIPELKINNNSFLYDLDTMLQKSYLSCGIKSDILFYIMYVEQKNEQTYLLTISQVPFRYDERLWRSEGFFKINDTYFFVKGMLPKKLFTITDYYQQFYYQSQYIYLSDKIIFSYERTCTILLEYRDEKLFFIRKR